MADTTKIVVGIALEQDAPEWFKTPKGLKAFGAGYEHHDEGPHGVLGLLVDSTWNDAVLIDDAKVAQLKARFKEITGKDAQLWVIGHQT